MKNYRFFQQEKSMCVAACLQSILDARGFPLPSQKEISSQFKKMRQGIDLDEESLNKFLAQYKLNAEHYHPSMNLTEPDLVIMDALENNFDNLVSFDYSILYKTKKPALHVSLLRDFDQSRVFLLDPEDKDKIADYSLLIRSIYSDIRCGFYLIN